MSSLAFCFGFYSLIHAGNDPVLEGRLWPLDRPVKVYVESSRGAEIQAAISSWNRVEGTPSLVQVRSLEEADLLIREMTGREIDSKCSRPCLGRASHIGFVPGVTSWILMRKRSVPGFSVEYVSTAAHEIGHVLGLSHSDECSLMSRSADGCPTFLKRTWNGSVSTCGPLPADVERIPGASGWGGWCLVKHDTDRPPFNWFGMVEVDPHEPVGSVSRLKINPQELEKMGVPLPGKYVLRRREKPG